MKKNKSIINFITVINDEEVILKASTCYNVRLFEKKC